MLEIKGLYKPHDHNKINGIDLTISKGCIASIECSVEFSNLLLELILGKVLPAGGEILINGQYNTDYLSKDLINTGVICVDEGYYERLTVDAYLDFISDLTNSSYDYKEIMMKLGLLDIGQHKIASLSYAQKRRLSFARERLKDVKVLLYQEPLTNLDRYSAKLIMDNIEEIRQMGAAILCTSTSYKESLLIGGQIYQLDELGFEEIKHEKLSSTIIPDSQMEKTHYNIDKIPAKLDDTILLFNPIEIEYIESENSMSYLNIRGERFLCTWTLNELEIRLKHLGFFRCHRSYLVNLQRVRELTSWSRNSYSLVLDDKNKSVIPLSKGRIEALRLILNL